MTGWKVAVAISLVFGIALAACSESGNGTTLGEGGACPGKAPPSVQDDAEMTVEELTNLVAEAITCPGYVFHMRSAGDYEAGPYSSYSETETWIDMQSGVGRAEMLFRSTSDEALAEVATAEAGGEDYGGGLESRGTWIVRSEVRYSSAQGDHAAEKGRSPSCHGPGREVLSDVLQCFDGPLQYFEISIDPSSSYNGRDAIAYVAEGESSGSDETYYTTRHAFFDAETYLPLGGTVEGTLDIGEIHPVQSDIPVEHEFVPLDSLPDDFFDPASIGYVETDEEAELDDAEIDVYWLGSRFDGEGEFPALAIRHVNVRPRARTPERGSIAEIAYLDADDEFGHILASVELYLPSAWAFREQDGLENPCEEIVEVDLPGALASIQHRGGQTADGTCDTKAGFRAVVRFEDVVVDIDASATNSGREIFYSPYDTEAGMEILIRGLKLRE